MARARITTPIQEKVLTRSARRCALCYGLDGSLRYCPQGQIAHVDRNNANATLTNLAYLCIVHHDTYDSQTRQSKGLIPGELRIYRQRLYAAIARDEHLREDKAVVAAVQIGPEIREHDRAAFLAGDNILSEEQAGRYFYRLGSSRSCVDSEIAAVDRFLRHFSLESHRFILEELEAPLAALTVAFKRLFSFTGEHFMKVDGKYRLNPELKTASLESSKRYYRYFAKLEELIGATTSAFREYRRTVKRTLYV